MYVYNIYYNIIIYHNVMTYNIQWEACIKVDTATGELVGADPGTPGATKVKVAVDFPAREAYVAWLVELCSRQGAAEQEVDYHSYYHHYYHYYHYYYYY